MPLKGIKVIELAGLAPVPFCGMILADFGATVIRVGRVGSGTDLDVLTNGKKSISLNLKKPKGVQILKQLCKTSDVLIEPYRPGIMEKLSLGPDILLKENPRLIYARLTGYGQHGYYADRAGHDINYVSVTGLLSLFGRKNSKPTPPVNLAADFGGGGLMCAFGVMTALFERSKSGLGQVIDANMVNGTAYLGSWIYRSQDLPIWGKPTGENILDSGAHFYDTYKTKDGKYMAIGSIESQFYAELLEKLNLDAEFDQYTDFEEKKSKLSEIFSTKTQAEWMKIFDSSDACVTPVLSLDDVKTHPHHIQNETFQINPNGSLCPTPAPKLSKTPGISKALLPPPKSGEHTFEILKNLHYSNDEISNLEKDGIIEITSNSKSKL
ncbi:alpha-methylacyl-CoA racemase [Chrysoperla carnea]|uniref:alpha-methylacyl-CoA racemase n=1 Tax=Chrysoperla carnea TaxID=189513 RepID=UPI001D08A300|nr:alpha-methylacyl-CoA racemase [Chrysoperla carnea]